MTEQAQGPKMIYAVTTGEYSDYMIHAVFEAKPDAERVAGEFRMRAEVEEWTIFPAGDTTFRLRTMYRASFMVDSDGTPIDEVAVQQTADPGVDEPTLFDPHVITWGRAKTWTISAYGRTEEQARKALSEYAAVVAQDLANGVNPSTKRPLA